MIADFDQRHHAFEGCFNFRDIGGYEAGDGRTVKWGLYYRAGRQDRMTERDLEQAKALGIRSQIDLRRPDEAAEQGPGPLTTLGASYYNIPVIPEGGSEQLSQLVGDTGISGKRYLGYLEFGPVAWQKMFELFAGQDNHAVVLHCTAGKDRTGVTTAFLLSVLGVGRDIIEADYILTNRDVERQVAFIENTVGLPEGMSRDQLVKVAGVPETAMKDFLDGMETKYGGPLNYLREIGIDDQQQAAIRDIYLE